MSILKELFGKEAGICSDDLSKLGGLYESEIIECKLWNTPKNEREKQDQIENLIIKPICGFLNRQDSRSGMLALGIKASKGVIEDLIPFEKNKLSASQISNYLRDRTGTIGNELFPFTRNVVEVPVEEDKQIILIEVARQDSTVSYYSKVTNHAWIREGDSTAIIDLNDLVRRVEAKRIAKIFVELRSTKINDTSIRIDIFLKNKGNLPARSVAVILHFHKQDPSPACELRNFSGSLADTTFMITEVIKSLYSKAATAQDVPIYPEPFFSHVGNFEVVTHSGCSLILIAYVNEEKGHSEQWFLISYDRTEITEIESARKFYTWL